MMPAVRGIMRIQNKRAVLVGGICFLACLIICATFIFSRTGEISLTLRGEVDAVSLYAHNVWFSDGEFQKKEVTDEADVDDIVTELTSIRCRNRRFPPDDLGGGWVLMIVLHYHNGESEGYEILLDGSEQVVIYPPAGRSMYGIWPDGNTLWDRIDAPAEVIDGEEMAKWLI